MSTASAAATELPPSDAPLCAHVYTKRRDQSVHQYMTPKECNHLGKDGKAEQDQIFGMAIRILSNFDWKIVWTHSHFVVRGHTYTQASKLPSKLAKILTSPLAASFNGSLAFLCKSSQNCIEGAEEPVLAAAAAEEEAGEVLS